MASSAVICIVNVENAEGGVVNSSPQAVALAPSLALSASRAQQTQPVHQTVHQDDIVLFEDDAGGTALDVATVDVASDVAEDADEEPAPPPPRPAPAPTRCVTQYIRFPVRGAVRVAGGDLVDDKHDEVLGVVAMDVGLGAPAVILGVVPADGKVAKSTTLSQALAHMKPYRKHTTVHIAKSVPSSTITTTSTPTLTALGQAMRQGAPPLLVGSKVVSAASLSKPTTRSATGAMALPEDKPATTNPIGTDGEPIKLPDNLESLPRAEHFPSIRHRWNTNEVG
ncbi:uncharacterized protein LOC127749578 [Frankliniella occidentalis]|uniref:Uncharacterized protein LOC127749578 n=1 Tax=Frankliniella occidentalis TaxID=133901 RepID=A0A9C6WZ34_FRAOC|nr:uncharacterized protein LOC127749578 [Frankliniella occidentalis]